MDLFDILKDRVKEAFKENAVSDEVIEFIARNTAKCGNGDARYAILLLQTAGLIADREMQPIILPGHVQEAQEKTDPKVRDEDITMLSDDERLVLLALARHLKRDREKRFHSAGGA